MFYEIIISDCSDYVNSLSEKNVECSIFLKPYFGICRIIPKLQVLYGSKTIFLQKNSRTFSEDCPAVFSYFVLNFNLKYLFFVIFKCKRTIICNICNYRKWLHLIALCSKLISAALELFFHYRTNSNYFAACLFH